MGILRTALVIGLLSLSENVAWPHGSSDHDWGPGGNTHYDNYDRIQKVEKKMMKIEGRLRDPGLSVKKRAKFEQKLKELRAVRERL